MSDENLKTPSDVTKDAEVNKAETVSEDITAKAVKKKSRLTLQRRKMINGYIFILPWFIGFVAFYLKSIVQTAIFSLSELNVGPVGGYKLKWVGLENYQYAFRVHPQFKQVLTESVMNMVIDVPLIIFFSLFMALLLNKKFSGRTLVRAIFFLPVILNAEAINGAMEFARTVMSGGVSQSGAEVAAAGTVNIDYYMKLFETLALPGFMLDYLVAAVARISEIITASGVQIVIFIAALQSIPSSMYEVARIEGATAYETFWKVTFPMVMPHIITNVVYTVVDSFVGSNVVELAYTTAFTNFDYGLSAAFSVISTVVTCLILVLVVRFIQKRTFYYN